MWYAKNTRDFTHERFKEHCKLNSNLGYLNKSLNVNVYNSLADTYERRRALSLLKLWKSIGGAGRKVYQGCVQFLEYDTPEDGNFLGGTAGFFVIYSNVSYSESMSNNSKIRFSMMYFEYGGCLTLYSLWGTSYRAISISPLLDTGTSIKTINIGSIADSDIF